MAALQRFNRVLIAIGSGGTILFIAVIAVVIPYEVIGRYLFGSMTIWSGEVSTYSLAWASMLGGAVGLKKGYLVSMTSLVDAVPSSLARKLKLVSHVASLFVFSVLFAFGLYQAIYNWNQTSPAIGIVMSVPYASLPAGFFIMFFWALEQFLLFLGIGKGEKIG